MYDPDLHLFITDDEILARRNLDRMVQTLRRESHQPVLGATGEAGDEPFGYTGLTRDNQTGQFKAWICSQATGEVRLAISDDNCATWKSAGSVDANVRNLGVGGITLLPAGPEVDDWFVGATYVGYCMFGEAPNPFGTTISSDQPPGIYMIRSLDGRSIDVRFPAVLPNKGDRSSMCHDEVSGEYFVVTRPYYGFIPGFTPIDHVEVVKHRMACMWRSKDLVHWDECGIVLRCDDLDPHDAQIYGFIPFRYGPMFLGFVEMYHATMERLDTQLAWSADGVRWQRVEPRRAVLPLGGEGAWDSHWVVPTNNPPFPARDRLLVPYVAAGTKHGSGKRHKRGMGMASIRKDGWVSLEAGRAAGTLVTKPLPLEKPMKLELNVDCRSGHIAAEIIPLDEERGNFFDVAPGYEADASRVEFVDSIRQQVTWNEKKVVAPRKEKRCAIRITMRQGSLFSFRWSEAG